MGYRSDVTIAFYPSYKDGVDFTALKLWVEENYPLQEAVRECGATVEYNEDANYIHISYADVKWYADYPHTKKTDAALVKLEKDFPYVDEGVLPRAHWEMMRIGEDYNDTDYVASGYAENRLNLTRKVTIDW